MTTRAINLSAEQVLAGNRLSRFTVPMKVQPREQRYESCATAPGWYWPPGSEPGEDGCRWPLDADPSEILAPHCPVQPGDTLWGRETYSTLRLPEYHCCTLPRVFPGGPQAPCCAYKATATYKCGQPVSPEGLAGHIWRSPVTMPRELSRFSFVVTSVGVQQVGSLTADDVYAEGIDTEEEPHASVFGRAEQATAAGLCIECDAEVWPFRAIWERRYGDRYPWPDAWAWVYEVEKRNGEWTGH